MAVQKGLGRGTKNAEKQPVQRAENNINGCGYFRAHTAGEQHHCAPKDRPNVKIGYPPHRNAAKDTRKQHENVNGDQRLDAVHHGKHNDKQRKQVHVWCPFKQKFRAIHQRAKHGENCHFPHRECPFCLFCGGPPGQLRCLRGATFYIRSRFFW